MPTISMFYGILMKMYWNDHAPPHLALSDGLEDSTLLPTRCMTPSSAPVSGFCDD